jgi:hypothetical protein
MTNTRTLLALLSAAFVSGVAIAEEPKIEGFMTDPVEVYDQNEDYIDDYEVGGLSLDQVKVLEEDGDLVKLDFAGAYDPAWVFKTDIKWPAGCRQAAGTKVAKAKNASTMGLDGDLCE